MNSKLIAFLAIALFGSLPAFSAEDPASLCDTALGCTAKMKEWSAEYAKGNLAFTKETLSGFSGACYHLDPQYDPEKAQFGAFAFKKDGANLLATGVFSYFYDKDPFEGMTASEMLPELAKSGNGLSKVQLEGDQATLDFSVPGTMLNYWFRESKGALILIGRESGVNYINAVFCKLQRHAQ